MDERLERYLRSKLRAAGRRFEETRSAFEEGTVAGDSASNAARFGLPTDDEGRARIVCRRHAEKRATRVDEEGRPACFDPEHPDCRGCAEDVREGVVETW